VKNAVVLARCNAITALGATGKETYGALLSGLSALTEVTRFPVGQYRARTAASIEGLSPNGHPLVYDLLDPLLKNVPPPPPDTLVTTCTTKAGIDSLERYKRGTMPDGLGTLPGDLCKRVSRTLGTARPSVNISAACASATVAIAQGASLIAAGMEKSVLVICADVITEFVFSGFSALQVLSPDRARPFDRSRTGLSLGEGAAFIHLVSGALAEKHFIRPVAEIAGWGVANDAFHVTAPARGGQGLCNAMHSALKRASLEKQEIAGISAHGTGTIRNDAMEIKAFHRFFSGRVPPAYSVKGAIGHTFGAAGGIEAVIATEVLRRRLVPPTVGLEEPEAAAQDFVTREPTPISGDHLMITNSGFGGVNAVLILKRSSNP
jgi:3-oxoacyl-[acyl-carrier-protein] synthase II